MLIFFLPLFLIFLMIGVPVFFAMIAAPGIMLYLDGSTRDIPLLFRNIYNGMDSFPLMAIPFFMLAGELMNRGGITNRLVDFAQVLIGHVRGGLAQVNILSSMLFAGLSGSAVADTSALGSMLIPAMEREGYTRRFAAAVTAASSVIGPIIPPSGIMIIYAYVMEVSVAALFAGGILPGILVGAGLMGVTHILAIKNDFPTAKRSAETGEKKSSLEAIVVRFILHFAIIIGFLVGAYGPMATVISLAVVEGIRLLIKIGLPDHIRAAFKRAMLPLLTPVIILGGILGGVFTPTEASSIAVLYALLLGMLVMGSVKPSDLPNIFTRAAISSAVVLLLVGVAIAFKTAVALSHAAEQMADFVLTLSSNPLVLLFLINILLFIVGMFLDAGPAIIILGPILGPVFVELGVHPVHFAMIMSVNLTVGLATPPMGLVLFVASSVSRERIENISKSILPFLAVEFFVIMLITFVPPISLAIPRALGLIT